LEDGGRFDYVRTLNVRFVYCLQNNVCEHGDNGMKKGQDLVSLKTVVIIIAVVSFIIFFPFIVSLGKFGLNYIEGGMCMASAGISSFQQEKVCYDYLESPVSINCDRRHVIIGATEAVVVQGKREKSLPVYSPENKQFFDAYTAVDGGVADAIVAEEMRRCWRQFGQGETVLLNQAKIDRSLLDDTRDETACFICSDISFAKPSGDEPAMKLDGNKLDGSNLGTYIKTIMPDEKLSYYDYFNNPQTICENHIKEGGRCWERLETFFTIPHDKLEEEGFDSDYINNWKRWTEGARMSPLGQLSVDENYLVVFVRKRFDSCQDNDLDPSDAELSNFVYTIEASEVNRLCDTVVS